MRKKDVSSTVKWSAKNKIYMQRLGFIDARSGKVRPEMNMSGFINECVTMLCESGMHPKAIMAGPDQLRHAWSKYCVAQKNTEIIKLQKEIIDIVKKTPINKKYDEALLLARDI